MNLCRTHRVTLLITHLLLYHIPRPQSRFKQRTAGHRPENMPTHFRFRVIVHYSQRLVTDNSKEIIFEAFQYTSGMRCRPFLITGMPVSGDYFKRYRLLLLLYLNDFLSLGSKPLANSLRASSRRALASASETSGHFPYPELSLYYQRNNELSST